MRQKKIKDATIENIKALGVFIEPEKLNLDSSKRITMEIGSGKGQFISTLAKDHPEELFIAVEMEQNVCYRLAQKKEEMGLDNLYIIMADAIKLQEYLDAKVDKIQLNFSDPWPKARHHKRRLTYTTYLNLYKELLSDEGVLVLRTDHFDFFNDSYLYITENNYQIIESNYNLEESNYMTEYEVKKRKSGPIYQVVAKK